MVEHIIKLLEPITQKIFKLEGNGIQINEVYMAFKDIKSTLNSVLPEISILDEQHKQNINNNVTFQHIGIELDEEREVDAMEYIHEVSQLLNIDVGIDLANYRAKEGLWGKSFSWKNVTEMDPVVWWKGLCRSKLLSRVAVRILTAPCTSAATESTFSTHAHIHSHKRNRLTTDRAAKVAYISYN
ncbi:unnamed protein product [Leptosia nina]|uniref:HAT C-terminal dimerisation domain-containing protein n=1 Tax=Leptosia nina TaxID=320188 RepID=A0AAV1J724_9NEOP